MLSRALSLATVVLLIGFWAAGPAEAQENLEAGKTPSQIFSGTCNACHKSPRGLLRSVPASSLSGFLRQHYTTGPEMSAAMAAYLVAAGSAPAKKDREKAAAAGQSADPAAKGKTRKHEQAATQPGLEGKEPRTARGKQLQAKSHDDRSADRAAHPAPVHPSPASETDAAARRATVLAPTPATPEQAAATPAPEPGPPLMTLDIPLPEMPTAPPADLTQSVFASSPVP